jgi:hypothetical protein
MTIALDLIAREYAAGRARELAGLPVEGRDTAAVLEAGAGLWAPEVVAALRRTVAGSAATTWTEDRARLALTVDLQLSAVLSPLDHEASRLEREASFVIPASLGQPEEERIPLDGALTAIAGERHRDRRRAMEQARTGTAAAVLGPNRQAAWMAESSMLRGAGGGTLEGAIRLLTSSPDDGTALCRELLDSTRDAYREALERLSAERLGIPTQALDRSDVLNLFLRQPADRNFAGEDLAEAARDQVERMGLARLWSRLRLDLESRAGKRPRPCAVPVEVPGEVVLLAWPTPGLAGRRALWHELGHGLHLASQSLETPEVVRRRGDRAVAEGWAILFGSIPTEPAWLKRQGGFTRQEAQRHARDLAAAELFLARRYAARWRVEWGMLQAPEDRTYPEAYAEAMREGTGIGYSRDEAWFDHDPGLAGLDYVRGWSIAAGLARRLRTEFDEDWFFNPGAGRWLEAEFRNSAPENASDTGVLRDWLVSRLG